MDIPRKLNTVVIPEFTCMCGYKVDRTTLANDAPDGTSPKKDDVSLCARCGTIHLFNADLTHRIATKKELAKIKRLGTWPEIEVLQKRIRDMSNLKTC